MDCVTVTTDKKYLNHTLCFLNTLNTHSDNIHVLLRAVNLSASDITMIKCVYSGIEIIQDNINLNETDLKLKNDQSWSWTGLKNISKNSFTYSDHMCYTNNMRFDNICTLLARDNVKRVINMDVDQLFINRFDPDDFFKNNEIVTLNEMDQPRDVDVSDFYSNVWIPDVWQADEKFVSTQPIIDESIIGCVNNNKTRHFFNQAREMIHQDFFNWDADFDILNKLYHQTHDSIKFSSPDFKFMDRWRYNDTSIIWNGAGNNRNTIKKYQHKHTQQLEHVWNKYS